jgi:hypothetical protein
MLPHSKLGIVSFLIAIAATVMEMSTVLTIGVLHGNKDFGAHQWISTFAGLVMIGGIGLALLGEVLAYIALYSRTRRIAFALGGLVLNGFIIILISVLLGIGVMM